LLFSLLLSLKRKKGFQTVTMTKESISLRADEADRKYNQKQETPLSHDGGMIMDELGEKIRSFLPALLQGDFAESSNDSWMIVSVLPEQFYSASSHEPPEAALMRAVLQDAINCVQEGVRVMSRRKQRLAREAEEWFFSDESHWPFSFLNICAVLGLEPQYIRRGLRRRFQQRSTQIYRSKRRVVGAYSRVKIAA
jgi:hypothetical protein